MSQRPYQSHSGKGNKLAGKSLAAPDHSGSVFHMRPSVNSCVGSIRRHTRKNFNKLAMACNDLPELINILQQNRMITIVEHQLEPAFL